MQWQGLSQLYGQYRQELYLYLCSLCQNEALAEDLLQETFVRAFFSLPQHHANVRAWLYLVGRNLYFDSCKKTKWISAHEESLSNLEHPGLEEGLIRDEKYQALYDALKQLDERKREILILQYFSGLSHKEISSILNIRPDYVRVLGCRAKKELKILMEEAGYALP